MDFKDCVGVSAKDAWLRLFIYLFILIAWFEMSVLSDEVAFYCFAVTVQKHLAVICDSEVWR